MEGKCIFTLEEEDDDDDGDEMPNDTSAYSLQNKSQITSFCSLGFIYLFTRTSDILTWSPVWRNLVLCILYLSKECILVTLVWISCRK